jgi:hypothetical protein
MLSVASATRVLVGTTPVDLRGSFNRPYSLVVEQLKANPIVRTSVRVHQWAAEPDKGQREGESNRSSSLNKSASAQTWASVFNF